MAKVTFTKTGNSFSLDDGSQLLELENDNYSELPFGCRNAACGTCALDVDSGMENLSPKNEDEQELLDALDINGEKRRLGCQCILHGDISITPLNN